MSRRPTEVLALALLLIGLLLAACSDPSGETQQTDRQTEASATTDAQAEPVEEPDGLVAATQGRFNPDKIELVAGESNEVPFVNNDPAPHNISVYVRKDGKRLFEGEPVGDSERTTYEIPPLKKGSYFFRCDIHPTMEGTVVVR